jgi:hypothetical protein
MLKVKRFVQMQGGGMLVTLQNAVLLDTVYSCN